MMARWRQLASEALGPRDHVQRKQQSRSEQRITANESRQQTPCIQGSLFFFLPEMHVAFRLGFVEFVPGFIRKLGVVCT